MIRRLPSPEYLWHDVVIAGCVYEIAALVSNRVPGPRLPTISELVLRAQDHKAGRFAAWMFVGGWAHHYLVKPPSPLSPIVEAASVVVPG